MIDLLKDFSDNLLLTFALLVVIVLFAISVWFSAAVNWLLKRLKVKTESTQYFLVLRLIGTLSITALALAADDTLVYLFSIVVIATLVTEKDFIKEVLERLFSQRKDS